MTCGNTYIHAAAPNECYDNKSLMHRIMVRRRVLCIKKETYVFD
jgi:hypothetical protein